MIAERSDNCETGPLIRLEWLTPSAGKVIGFIDRRADFGAFAAACRAPVIRLSRSLRFTAGAAFNFYKSCRTPVSFFGDAEDRVIQLVKELEQGHDAAAVVTDQP